MFQSLKIVYSHLLTFLDKHKVITKNQFGFRNKHSNIHALISYHALISLTENTDSGNFSYGTNKSATRWRT